MKCDKYTLLERAALENVYSPSYCIDPTPKDVDRIYVCLYALGTLSVAVYIVMTVIFVFLCSSDSSDVDDLDDTSHMPLTALRTPYQNLGITGPAQAGMIYSHHRKLGRYVCTTHSKLIFSRLCSHVLYGYPGVIPLLSCVIIDYISLNLLNA